MEPLLRLDAISKSFAGVHALKDVSFELQAGEVHGLIGENGAGKSTLVKVITGAHEPDSGTMQVAGQIVARNDPGLSRALGIAAIYQQPALFADLMVAENIALRLERGSGWRLLRWRQRRRNAAILLERVGCDISPDAQVRSLSMPQQQLVEIAAALGSNARILILDEPTASLSDREVENLFRVIRSLRERGVGMIYISHRLEELEKIADRVTILRDGRYVATRSIAQVSRAELIRLMVGRELSAVFPKISVTPGETLLETHQLICHESGISEVSLSVRAGEILGLAGLVGSGRTELARVLFGLTPADAGDIHVRGKAVAIDSPGRAIELGIAYVPEDRRRHGVILDMPITANATLAVLRKVSTGGLIDFTREHAIAASFVEKLAIKSQSLQSPVSTLSGGNQQKVALARWLATEPSVLILDEPTQGVDVGAKAEIHKLMGELTARGLAIIMISSELPEILGMSDRIAVMHAGRVAGILEREQATQEKVLELALGHAERATAAA
ncbi:MAG TPA: sugar ABC transporter ATP-binding protein [Tepidisphaeraceae bacterium]|nr:sugar ABC transporter ATP-binding protein [Tepidisphaeraceae bacterium]